MTEASFCATPLTGVPRTTRTARVATVGTPLVAVAR